MPLIRSGIGILFFGLLAKRVKTVKTDFKRIYCHSRYTKMDTNEHIEYTFNCLIQENDIVIFSKTTCPFCVKVKQIFADLKRAYRAFELNTYDSEKCTQMQNVLEVMSGQRTVPNVFIRGQHVGGCSDTEKYLADGTLIDRLEGTYQQYDYDYIVIGGGSGGLASAKEAASHERNVALCDYVSPSPQGTTWGLGGTCVNVGCIPKKLMHKAAILADDLKDSAHFGWTTEAKEHVWSEMVENVQNYIHSLNFNYRTSLKNSKVTYYNAFAKFLDKHTILLTKKNGAEETITGQNILLATGCRPRYPNIPGAKEHCISSDDVFSMVGPPGKTLIIGASYIALETAGFLIALGFDVTVMVRSILLRGFDREIANKIGENLKEHGVKFIENCVPREVKKIASGMLEVTGSHTDGASDFKESFQTVLVAIGRDACINNIGLEDIGVEFSSGKVKVDEENRSTVRNIFAVGDIIEDQLQLTPVAIQEGVLLAKRLFGKSKTLMDYKCVPTTVFTPLEYGCCGLSEEKAIEQHEAKNIEVYHVNFQPLEWALSARNKNKSFAKLICLKTSNDLVLGFHYLGPNAGEVTQGFALALKLGATKNDFDSLIGIHPTCAEMLTTMTITKSSGRSPDAGSC